ncbi:MAG: DNA-processing protein DprA [Candidatus Omnitrophica bacterium]|nr:DNA-processing protein DprA [Candidatus Omnitrophota bacterium]
MNRIESLVALNKVGEIGSVRLKRLIDFFGDPERVINAPKSKLALIQGIGEDIACRVASIKKEDIDRELNLVKDLGLKIITIEDSAYPDNLKNIPGAPIVLYIKGELIPEDKLAIGIVGSRRASFYGLNQAQDFAFGLANQGFTIVSGMARGVDTYSHKGALKAGKRTIAVIGSGFNYLYPEENKKLADEISQNGAVISEFPLDTKPLPYNFPRRNRLISGMSLGVLVVEAARNSGALITADFALEQGREVFAIPGKIDSANSFGTNELIKQGAKLVANLNDILEEFNFTLTPVIKKSAEDKGCLNNKEEENLYGLISDQAIQLDDLAGITGLDVPRISGILFNLMVRKLIRELPGKHYVRYS